MRRAAVPAMHPKMIAAIVPPEMDLVATFLEGPPLLPLIVSFGPIDGLVSEGVDWTGSALLVVVVVPDMVVGFSTEVEDVVLVVDETLGEDEVSEVVEEIDKEVKGDEVDVSEEGALEEDVV